MQENARQNEQEVLSEPFYSTMLNDIARREQSSPSIFSSHQKCLDSNASLDDAISSKDMNEGLKIAINYPRPAPVSVKHQAKEAIRSIEEGQQP
jgi:hypothetical protein